MRSSKQENAILRAQQYPGCVECLTRLTGPEIYTVTRFRDNRVLAWDIDLACQICGDGRPAFPIPREVLDTILQVNGITPDHMDHVDLSYPGIACAVDRTPEGQAVLNLIDGSHRAARARRDGGIFFAYFLTDEESQRCQSTDEARCAAYLETLLRSHAVQRH